MKQSAAIVELLEALAHAFPSRPLYKPSAFAPDAGYWAGYLNADAFVEGIADRSWDQLDSKFLEFHHDALAYFGPNAFASMLPAYLAAFIKGGKALNMLPTFLLSDLTRPTQKSDPKNRKRFDARVALLSNPQKRAVASILEALAQLRSHSAHREPIEDALASFWRHLDTPKRKTR